MKEVLKALNQKPIGYYPVYHKITSSLHGGILLSQLMYWFSKKDKFHKKNEALMIELGFTERELRTAKSALKKVVFVTVSKEGNPSKNYYSIDWDLYFNSLKNCVDSVTTSNDDSVTTSNDDSVTTIYNENLTKTTTKTTTKIKNNKKEVENYRKLLKRLEQSNVLKSKIDFTTKGAKLFKALGKSEDEVVSAYLAHYNSQTDVKFSKRIAKFLELWDEMTGKQVDSLNFRAEVGSIDWIMEQNNIAYVEIEDGK